MFIISTNKNTDTATWTPLVLYWADSSTYDPAGEKKIGGRALVIMNNSGNTRLFRVNGGAPITLIAAQSIILDLGADGVHLGKFLVETDTATLTSLFAGVL